MEDKWTEKYFRHQNKYSDKSTKKIYLKNLGKNKVYQAKPKTTIINPTCISFVKNKKEFVGMYEKIRSRLFNLKLCSLQ